MKKLFGHKPKAGKAASGSRDFSEVRSAASAMPEFPVDRSSRFAGPQEIGKPSIPTPVYHKLATHGNHIQGPLSQQQQQQSPPTATPPVGSQQPNDEHWEVVQTHPDAAYLPNPHPPAPPPIIHTPSRTSSFTSLPPAIGSPLPTRSGSPMSINTNTNISAPNKLIRHHDRERDVYVQKIPPRKKSTPTAPVALGILRALEPPRSDGTIAPARSHSEENERYSVSDSGHQPGRDPVDKREKRGFWPGRDKEKEREREKEKEREKEREIQQRERERERERERMQERERERGREVRREDEGQGQAELTRMIGYLTATASEDWALVLEVCERASTNEASAKEAVRALRREFKYGEPAAQLSAARLWAIMLRNASDLFISQSTSRKFLDTLEDLLSSSRTSPVVRERLLEVVAAAAYASGSKKDSRHDREGFKGLWKRVKPFDKPEEGMPFDIDDAMFHPPASGRLSGYEVPIVSYQEASPLPVESAPPTPTPNNIKKRKSPTRNRIIPQDEDMRRLFQECKIGQGNAGVLCDALVRAKPEDLRRKDVIKEFYAKCRASQELIYAQIPWATSIAERSRSSKDQEVPKDRKRTMSNDLNLAVNDAPDSPVELTLEEKLLAALLGANAELLEALKQWEDLNRIAIERKVEDRSRKETRMERRHQDYEFSQSMDGHPMRGSSSRTPSPASRSHSPLQRTYPPLSHPRPHHLLDSEMDPSLGQNLAPPPAAPHGPRSPAQISLHSRTPSPTPRLEPYMNGLDLHSDLDSLNGYEDEDNRAHKPSAKALGKRKVVDADALSGPQFDSEDIYLNTGHTFTANDGADPDFDDDSDGRWRHPPVHFVYDAVAERTRQRLVEDGGHEQSMNGVH